MIRSAIHARAARRTGRGATRLVCAALSLLACSPDAAEPPDAGGDRLRISMDSARLWVGDTVRLTAGIRRPDGSVHTPALQWSSTTPAVEISPDGVVRAVARGTGLLRVTGGGSSADIPVTSLPVIRGRVVGPAGVDRSGLYALWRARGAANADSVGIQPDGHFEIRSSSVDSAGELVVDGRAPRSWHPFRFPFAVDSLDGLDMVLVPRKWMIRNGIFQGDVVDVPLDPVVDDDVASLAYTYFFASQLPFSDPVTYTLSLKAWPAERLPARVVFDHAHSAAPISPQDSAAIWQVLDRMIERFGLDLFQPAVADAGWWPAPPGSTDAGFIPGVIRLTLESSWLARPAGDPPTLVVAGDLGELAPGSRFTKFQISHQQLGSGHLSIGPLQPLRLADGFIPWETVLVHEMLHVLGVGHTCRIPSPQGPCMRTAESSRHDVAYMELLREILRLQFEYNTPFSILPATIGERTLLLGVPALPALTR